MTRQKIVDVVLENLKNIKIDKGFYSDAGKNVFEWMDKTLEDRDFPAIIIRDSSSKVSDQSLLEHILRVEVDVATKGKNSAWNMREVSSDVLKTFGIIEDALNFKVSYLGFESLVEQRESMYSGTRMEFEIIYHSRRFEQ